MRKSHCSATIPFLDSTVENNTIRQRPNRQAAARLRRRCRVANRTGAAVVELAIVVPILLMIFFGMIEIGRAIMVQQVLTNASREGARRAIIESSTTAEVEEVIGIYLQKNSISGATVTVTPNSLSQVGFGDPVMVVVSVPIEDVSWLPSQWFLNDMVLEGRSVMRGERPE